MQYVKARNGLLLGAITGFCLLVIIFIWANHIHQVSTDKEDTIATAVQRNSNLVVALENFALGTIRNADAVLQLVRFESQKNGKDLSIDEILFSHAVNKTFFEGCAVLNEKGTIINTNITLSSDTVLNFSHRDYFIHHLNNNADNLYISKPLMSRTIGKAVIFFSRRINKADGSFGGVVVLQMEPRVFTSFYAQANLRKYDIISLISPDGITYARRTGNVESYGENISKSPLFQHLKQSPVNSYFAKDAIRNIPTYFSYRKIKEYPIIATVGTSQADVLENFYKRASRDRFSAIVISLLVLLFAILVAIILQHRKRMSDRMIEDEQRYQRKVTEQVILAQEKEREVIGRELHDNVNQVLTTVKLYLEMALSNKEQKDPLIQKSMQLVLDSINEIRNLSRDLSAPTLGTKSMIDSISALVEMVSSSGKLNIRFQHEGYNRSVCMNQKLAVYRIVQEQLNNIIKHSGAKNVWITLSQNAKHTTLIIKDDGKGFDTSSKRNGIGINNIRSRVNVFDGDVRISSSPGNGCTLVATLPFTSPEEEDFVVANTKLSN